MAIHSKSRSYPPRGSRRVTRSLPAPNWRHFGWLVPGLLVLALLSFGWWKASKGRIQALPAVDHAVAGGAVPSRVDIALLPLVDGEATESELVARDAEWKAPAESGYWTGDDELEALVLDRPARGEVKAQISDGSSGLADELLHVVRPGETLYAVARQHDVSVDSLSALNSLRDPDLLWVGQQLRLAPAETRFILAGAATNYTVEPGESLLSLAVRYGTSPWAIAVASELRNPSLIYPGQRLLIPGQEEASPEAPAQPEPIPPAEGKWIDVDLTAQQVVAYEGTQPVFSAIVSTGLPDTPTVTGRYRIYLKYRSQTMYGGSLASGDYYYLPDVPYVQYFHQGYAFHGTYWHDNFGQPMSRGCVNMRTDDARWLFEWAEPAVPPGQNQTWADDQHSGTLVVVHY